MIKRRILNKIQTQEEFNIDIGEVIPLSGVNIQYIGIKILMNEFINVPAIQNKYFGFEFEAYNMKNKYYSSSKMYGMGNIFKLNDDSKDHKLVYDATLSYSEALVLYEPWQVSNFALMHLNSNYIQQSGTLVRCYNYMNVNQNRILSVCMDTSSGPKDCNINIDQYTTLIDDNTNVLSTYKLFGSTSMDSLYYFAFYNLLDRTDIYFDNYTFYYEAATKKSDGTRGLYDQVRQRFYPVQTT